MLALAFGCSPKMAVDLGAQGMRVIVRLRQDVLRKPDPAGAIRDMLSACYEVGLVHVLLTLRWEHDTEEEIDVPPSEQEAALFYVALREAMESEEWQRMKVTLQLGNEPERMWHDEETLRAMLLFTERLWLRTYYHPNVQWATAAITAGSLLVEPDAMTPEIRHKLTVMGDCLGLGQILAFDYHDLHLNIASVEDAERAIFLLQTFLAFGAITPLPLITSECSTVRDPHLKTGNTPAAVQTIRLFGDFLRATVAMAAFAQGRAFGSGDFLLGAAHSKTGERQEPWFTEWRRVISGNEEKAGEMAPAK